MGASNEPPTALARASSTTTNENLNNHNTNGSPPFNPFDEMDPTNINYVHSVDYNEMHQLLHTLPEGWIKRTPDELTALSQQGASGDDLAPYLHEPSGRVSWKNPNFHNIMSLANDLNEEKKLSLASGEASGNKRWVELETRKKTKKLRLMLQAGAPLGAVEQKAKLEGIDMKLVLSEEEVDAEESKVSGHGEGRNKSNNANDEAAVAESISIPETLLKKYKRMLKAGVPMDRVQQLAGIETKALPEQVEQLLTAKSGSRSDSDCESKKETMEVADVNPVVTEQVDPRMVKFVRMQKAGIPKIAICNTARLQGFDLEEVERALNAASSVAGDASAFPSSTKGSEEKENETKGNTEKHAKETESGSENRDDSAKHDKKDVIVKSDRNIANGNNETSRSTVSAASDHFSIQPGKVSFPTSSRNSGSSHMHFLTDLVRKMAQTVEKTSRFSSLSSTNEVVVDNLTLFHSLGSLKGVQFARDEYNSTLENFGHGNDNEMEELFHSKRHGFVEMAQSIGMALDTHSHERVDIPGLDDLISHIESTFQVQVQNANSLLEQGYYDFESLFALYPPGSHVVAKHAGGGGIDSIAQVAWHRYTQGTTIMGKPMKYFQVCVRYLVQVGGGKVSFAEVVDGMEMFEGRRSVGRGGLSGGSVSSLSFVPIFKQEREVILEKYSLRGEMLNSILSSYEKGETHSFVQYEKGCFFQKRGGSSSFSSGKSSSMALATGGRIIVDFDAAVENGHTLSIGRDDMMEGFHLKRKEFQLHLRLMDQNRDRCRKADAGGFAATSGGHRKDKHSNSGASNAIAAGDMILFSKIPQEYLALVWPLTVGFSLTSKSWGDVVIDGLKEISFDPDIFDCLVLPESRKRMIRALVKHTSAKNGGFHDLVKGKGEGTVFLLYGEPGVGKTLTAEAVAEVLHRPLYSVSMGTLGTTAEELERRLGEILHLSGKWDAIVLLDEADSFLEARSSNSPLERNAMVSVMLRLVEYHQGILFLTSNRIDALDPAFQTRINLALRYEALPLEGRAKVWENLLMKSGFGTDSYSFDTVALAKPPLNGREIKNALRLAMALAAEEGGDISQELLLETAMVVNDYKASMKGDWEDDHQKTKPRGWFSWWNDMKVDSTWLMIE